MADYKTNNNICEGRRSRNDEGRTALYGRKGKGSWCVKPVPCYAMLQASGGARHFSRVGGPLLVGVYL